ncbi:uncharacterized protein TRIADDRAFT_20215, partial [Trichoplax adhaerens]
VYYWGGGKFTPQKLNIFKGEDRATQVSAGKTHYAVVTVEKGVFTWANTQGGQQMAGQLGHSDKASYRVPKRVEIFHNEVIKQAVCGDEFTLFLSDNGALYSCGSNYYGCLGLEENEENEEDDDGYVLSPTAIELFSNIKISQITCGESHVLALTDDKEVYSWGCGEFGRLGLGSEDDYFSPQKVKINQVCLAGKGLIKSVHCGSDFSFLLTISGRVIAFGNNEHNQLGLNSTKNTITRNKPRVRNYFNGSKFNNILNLLYDINYIAAGQSHAALIDKFGRLITMGSNKCGERGIGNFKQTINPTIVSGVLSGKIVHKVACGDSFTVIATTGNQLYSCGWAEDGRLGIILPPSEKGVNNGWTHPRPIFGSLHHVSSLSCNYWHTIVVAG